MTISERLRNDVCLTSKLDWQEHVALAREGADTIDALVAALENFVNNDEYCREDYEEAEAALALARKGG